jgi:ParB/RepB/Spo0J family partition protein
MSDDTITTTAKPAKFDLTGLVPDYRPADYTLQYVLVATLPEGNGGRYPDAQFLASVDRQGVLEPLVLQANGNGSYDVLDGWKRLTAARTVGLTTVPAVVTNEDDGLHSDVVTLATNNLRSDNLAAEYRALARLMEEHGDLKKIAAATGVKYQTLYRIWKLRKLDTRLLQALEDGKINAWAAETASRYPQAEQDLLVQAIANGEKITSQYVVAMRRQRVADKVREAQQAQPDLFGPVDLGGASDDEAEADEPQAAEPVAEEPAKERKPRYLEPAVVGVSPKVAAKQADPMKHALAHLVSAAAFLDQVELAKAVDGATLDATYDANGLVREALAKLRGQV